MTVTTVSRRAAVLAGLAELADFIEAHPGLPVDPAPDPFNVHVIHGTDEEKRAEVDRIAGILGVTARLDQVGSCYLAERRFPGGVTYTASAMFASEIDRSRLFMAPYIADIRERIAARQGGEAA